MGLFWFVLLACFLGVFTVEYHHTGKLAKENAYNKGRLPLKIINGNKTSVAKYPFIASVIHSSGLWGSAVVLNKRWLLTTAFAVAWETLPEIQFRVGSNSYSEEGQVLRATKVVLHPNYTGTWDWNIAVVKTGKPIRFGKKVKPIKLSTQGLAGGTKAWVAGWGETNSSMTPSDVLLEARVTVYDWTSCAKIYNSDLTKRLMCSYDKAAGPCSYDFGDPLVVNKVLYGLFAGGYDCASPASDPVLYTNVASLYQWIQDNIKGVKEEDSIKTSIFSNQP